MSRAFCRSREVHRLDAIGLVQADRIESVVCHTFEAGGCIIVPGLVDIHVHLIGGGGEAGPASRTPECQLSDLLNAGITTVVGVLGTDCVSRRQAGHLTSFSPPSA